MRKAQGLSMSFIILAAIGLIVFVVVLAIFSGNIFDLDQGLGKCENNKGSCIDDSVKDCTDLGGTILDRAECTDENQFCCVGILDAGQ